MNDRKTASLSLSTVPGPTSSLFIMENRVSEIVFSVPPTIDLHAFSTLMSYNDHVTVTITVDAALYSREQADSILETFNEDLKTLVQSISFCVCNILPYHNSKQTIQLQSSLMLRTRATNFTQVFLLPHFLFLDNVRTLGSLLGIQTRIVRSMNSLIVAGMKVLLI